MVKLIIEISRYAILVLISTYTIQSFMVFTKRSEESMRFRYLRQNLVMFSIHFVAFMVLFLKMEEPLLLYYYGAQVIYLAATLILFRNLYPKASKVVLNNMCMLITVGFIMLTRLSYDQSTKQFKILVVATVIALVIPIMIRKLRFIARLEWVYALIGIALLGVVAVMGLATYGAKITFTFGGITLQPSEFVKILYVFFIAGMLAKSTEFKNVVLTTILAAIHVLILVVSTDLGGALIYFITYLIMLFVATRDFRYLAAGILGGSGAAVSAYYLFSHVRVRIVVWKDPFSVYEGDGYQIAQSLFAIAAGGWLGTGLFQGSPGAVPIVDQDFMFAAIVEELGGIFGICLILICMSCFITFVNIAMKMTNNFYRYVALGLGCMYAIQVFLTVGGAMKMIPVTGVTLPFISTGGSSILSTMIVFSIIQGLYILREDEGNSIEEEAY